jgi:hypothetical protein
MSDADQPPAARVAAAKELLDRGWGKPAQALELTDKVQREHSGLSPEERRNVIALLRDGIRDENTDKR